MVTRYNIKLNNTLFKSDLSYNETSYELLTIINNFKNTNEKITITATSETKKELVKSGFSQTLKAYDIERVTINIEH